MTDQPRYTAPEGQLPLSGPVTPPEQGGLPVRGDLAHIALAGTHFVAHYAIPDIMHVGSADASLLGAPSDDAEIVVELKSGSMFEALDMTSEWAWGCCGPDGPTGYIRRSALAS